MFECSIAWLRRDLRLKDHRILYEATQNSKSVLPIFIIDSNIVDSLDRNDRRITFIQESIDELNEGLCEYSGQLLVLAGDPVQLIPEIAKKYGAEAVYAARDYETYAKKRDSSVEKNLKKIGVEFLSFKDQVIFESDEILNGSGKPYRVFTPYSKNWLKQFQSKKQECLREYRPQLGKVLPASAIKTKSTDFWSLGFKKQKNSVVSGEKSARKTLSEFGKLITGYDRNRDFPAREGTSGISVHLRFGTLSIRDCFRMAEKNLSAGARTWMKELIWREFYQMILDQFPHVEKEAFRSDYAKISWPGTKKHFQAWVEGKTGYPIVDAAMRELAQTGRMHNRLRMIVAMFLTKDLLVDWRWGERYFAEKLLDYDLASNNGGWQWIASTGCDAQPYFRVMNPTSQGERFDPECEYIRKWVPEFEGENYCQPIVNHAEQRLKAIQLFRKASLKS